MREGKALENSLLNGVVALRPPALLEASVFAKSLAAALVAFLFAGFAPSAHAIAVLEAVEMGGDVVISGGGTLRLGAWTDIVQTDDFGRVSPASGDVVVGPTPNIPVDRYQTGQNFMGPSSFGTGADGFADLGSGDIFGIIFGADDLEVPRGYVSGDPLSGSSTYSGETFASLGMDLGSYTWSWGSGDTADSLTLNVVPEPSSALLAALGLAGLAALRRRSAATDPRR